MAQQQIPDFSKPYTKLTVEITFDHPDWVGDGQDERIAVEALGHELDRFLPRTSWRIMDVETVETIRNAQ